MKSIALVILFTSLSAFAGKKGYWVALDIYRNGEKIASPQMLVEEGVKAQISEKNDLQESSVELVAGEGQIASRQGILLKMKVDLKDLKSKQASQILPQILLKDGDTAEVIVGKANGSDEIKVTAFVQSQDFEDSIAPLTE